MFCSKIWITMEVAIMKEITLLFLEFVTICCVTTQGSRNSEHHLISGGLHISGPINRMSLRLMIKFSSDCGILGSKMIYLSLCFNELIDFYVFVFGRMWDLFIFFVIFMLIIKPLSFIIAL